MGLFFRKSFKAGPFRINLSKSGVGFSAGVKGARISTGPRGTELHLGRKGIYYRKKLGGGQQSAPAANYHQTAALYPQVNLYNCVYLNYESGYFDVVRVLGLPDHQITTGPPEAKIPNTILIYQGRGAVFLIYEKENWTNLGNARYLGTITFHPGRVLHTTIEEFRPLLEAYAKEQDANQPAPAVYATPAKKRRWPIYVFILLVLGTAGKIIEQIQTSTPVAVNPTAQASPSPTAMPSPQQAKRRRAQSQKTVSTLNSEPVIISKSPETANNATPPAAPEMNTPVSRSYTTAARSSIFGARSSSGRSYILGPRGGCYYISSSGSKVYVDHSYCY